MDQIHRLLAYGAAAATAGAIAWSLALVVTGRPAGSRFERYQAAVTSILVVAAASGVLLLAAGSRPRDVLHFAYAVVAIGAIPLARSFFGRSTGKGAAGMLLVAFIVLAALTYRLFATGGS